MGLHLLQNRHIEVKEDVLDGAKSDQKYVFGYFLIKEFKNCEQTCKAQNARKGHLGKFAENVLCSHRKLYPLFLMAVPFRRDVGG